MAKKEQIGTCSICGENIKLSFEHFPPLAARNNLPVMIQDYNHLTPIGNPYLYGKAIRSNRGMGGYKLCEPCNNNTGSWYAEEYSRIVNSNLEEIIEQNQKSLINFKTKIKPLNFLKQILIFHLCADQELGTIRKVLDSKKLILTKAKNDISNEIGVYMYATFSEKHRNIGICTMFSSQLTGIVNYSEFNFHPFGFLLTLNSVPPNYELFDITKFANYKYNEEVEIEFNLPNLPVKTTRVGHYP